MSRRTRKPLPKRNAGDRPKGARPFRGAEGRPQGQRVGNTPSKRFGAPAPRAKPTPAAAQPKGHQKELQKDESALLPTKVQTVVVTADENNMRVDRFLEARFPGLSFSHIQRFVRKGELRVYG